MTGTKQSSSELDPRRARIHFRAWHRGIKEMDLVLGQFVDTQLKDLSDAELDELEQVMSLQDADLVKWVTGEVDVPSEYDTPLVRRILDYKPDF